MSGVVAPRYRLGEEVQVQMGTGGSAWLCGRIIALKLRRDTGSGAHGHYDYGEIVTYDLRFNQNNVIHDMREDKLKPLSAVEQLGDVVKDA